MNSSPACTRQVGEQTVPYTFAFDAPGTYVNDRVTFNEPRGLAEVGAARTRLMLAEGA
jgi:hypothetical protein